jgi:hypothetical protein
MEQTILTIVLGLISVLLTVVGFFGVRTLKKIDANQTMLFDRVSELSKDFYTLKGAHDAYIMRAVRHE